MEHTAFQSSKLSCSRFTRLSSARVSSKQLIGARKMIALMSSKYGYHACRCRSAIRMEGGTPRRRCVTHQRPCSAHVVNQPLAPGLGTFRKKRKGTLSGERSGPDRASGRPYPFRRQTGAPAHPWCVGGREQRHHLTAGSPAPRSVSHRSRSCWHETGCVGVSASVRRALRAGAYKPGPSSGLIPLLSSTALTVGSAHRACMSSANDAMARAACSTLGWVPSARDSDCRDNSDLRDTDGRCWCCQAVRMAGTQ